MPMESMPVFKSGDIDNQIRDSAKQENITITQIENDAINKIVKKFAGQYPHGFTKENIMSFVKLDRWCSRNVGQLIDEYPQLANEIDKIRLGVRNEIVYQTHKDVFDNASNEIVIYNPETINSTWLAEHEKRFKYLVKRFYKTQDGDANWEYIRRKLNISDERWIPVNKGHPTEIYIEELKETLEKEQPKKFNQRWILSHLGQVGYANIKRHLKLNKKNIRESQNKKLAIEDWNPLLDELGEKWRDRWFPTRGEHDSQSMYEDKNEVNSVLKDFEGLEHTIVMYLSESEEQKAIAREITTKLIQIAQRGNKIALDILLTDLTSLGQELLIKYSSEIGKVMLHESQIRKALMVCIFRCDVHHFRANVFTYFIASLKMQQDHQPYVTNKSNRF